MRVKKGFVLHEVCGENIIVAEGKENVDFNNIISMNSSSAFLWKKFAGTEFTVADLVVALCSEYDVDATTAEKDCKELADNWFEAGIVEE